MKFGFVLPFGDARTAAETAHVAETAGWDGFFVPEAPWHVDAWIQLAAAAMVCTQRLSEDFPPARLKPLLSTWKPSGLADFSPVRAFTN